MKVPLYDQGKKEVGSVELPAQFNEPVRADLIKRAVFVINANSRQAYGAKPDAGQRASAKLSRRRHNYRGAYGHGISRMPRKIMTRRGTQMNWVGAVSPGTVKGRRAHPPKATKIWTKQMNKKERRLAIRSAISATVNKEIVAERGHKVPDVYPFVVDNSFESMTKTSDLQSAFNSLGLEAEMERVNTRKVRAGKGKMRGRKYKSKVGPLVVVSEKCDLLKSGKNIMGVDVVLVHKLNAKLLAPNATVGRMCIFTKKAVERLANEKLFTNNVVVGEKK